MNHSIPAGLHAFNVSVTDGKFTVPSFVEVQVGDESCFIVVLRVL